MTRPVLCIMHRIDGTGLPRAGFIPTGAPMTAEEFFAKLKAVPEIPTDVDGNPISELAGLMLKPIGVTDMMAVSEYAHKHGEERAWEAMLARGLLNLDGTQVVPDDRAHEFRECLNKPMKRALDKIRRASGYDDDTPAPRDPDALGKDEKKTSSTDTPTTNPSSGLPGISKKPLRKS